MGLGGGGYVECHVTSSIYFVGQIAGLGAMPPVSAMGEILTVLGAHQKRGQRGPAAVRRG